MSLWDEAINSTPMPPKKDKRTPPKKPGYQKIQDDSLEQSLLQSEQELVSPQESALLQKISGIRIVSEQDLINEEARDRAEALSRLHGDVSKVHEVFADIQTLVSQQSENVTSIENDIETAHSSTTSGIDQLNKASKHQKQGFKCIIIALAVTAGILALFAVAVVVYTNYAL
mmetsp:Transcript_15805/g.20503  ORF Transcript_15805/g.20503 Transcript_15805/m.20503 type:complete len:172 (-) Transcript_15805:200-715(-)